MKLIRLTLAAGLVLGGCSKQSSEPKPTEAETAKADGKDGKLPKLGKDGKPERPARQARPDVPPPPDVAAVPADAQKTAKGVAYKVLTPGKPDGKRPGPNDMVQVHYTGWTTDGKMFDSSIARTRPAKFSLNAVIPGWTDGLQTMTTGGKSRLWIPEELAYKGKPNAPQGMLVFDIELIDVVVAPEVPADVAAAPKNAKRTKKGVSYVVLTPGTGKDKPREFDRVKVNYSGWTTDGKMFDSSVTRGRPAEFSLNGVMPGWTDGIQTMVTGQKNRFWIPEELANQGKPGRAKGTLVFDVELLEVKQMPEPPPAPKDVAAAPKSAKKTEKGVAYKVLTPGKGTEHPKPTDKVKVHYSGWTTDGKMFDSSVTRGEPITFPLTNVIPGWTDGLQVMVVGEKTRFWIPEEMAYKGKPGRPQGMLVFDVELLGIEAGGGEGPGPGGGHGMPAMHSGLKVKPRQGEDPTGGKPGEPGAAGSGANRSNGAGGAAGAGSQSAKPTTP